MTRVFDGWFEAAPAERLALVRMLIGGFGLSRVAAVSDSVVRRTATDMTFVHPVGLMRVLSGEPSSAVAVAVVGVAALTGLAFVLGWSYRWLAPVFAASLLAIFSYLNSFGMIYHADQLLVLHTGVLAVAPAADAWSVDSRGADLRAPDWRYGWPLRLLCALTVSIYALSGIAKLAAHGWDWALGHAVRAQVGKDGLRKQLLGEQGGLLASWVYQSDWFATSVGIGTLVIELGAPLTLGSRRASRTWALAAFGMHWGVLLIMDIKFRYQLSGTAFVSFFEVERWIARRVRSLGQRTRPSESRPTSRKRNGM